MRKAIIYCQTNGLAAVVFPAPEAISQMGLEAIARQAVPAGRPYKIVDADELPWDVPQEAWEVDEADLTDGVGGQEPPQDKA